jgi:hypothetical protein
MNVAVKRLLCFGGGICAGALILVFAAFLLPINQRSLFVCPVSGIDEVDNKMAWIVYARGGETNGTAELDQ